MASIGVKTYGIMQKIPIDSVVIPRQLYEVRTSTDKPPENESQAYEMCRQIKAQTEADGTTHVTYVEVRGNIITMQFWCEGTPSLIMDIIVIGILVVLAAFAISAVLHEAYKIVSVLGPETVKMLTTIFLFALMLIFVSKMMDVFRR